jgi:hypothetical protein
MIIARTSFHAGDVRSCPLYRAWRVHHGWSYRQVYVPKLKYADRRRGSAYSGSRSASEIHLRGSDLSHFQSLYTEWRLRHNVPEIMSEIYEQNCRRWAG